MSILKHGDRITCKIHGVEIDNAMIGIERGLKQIKINQDNEEGWDEIMEGRFYICQDIKDGAYKPDKFRYRYTWMYDSAVKKIKKFQEEKPNGGFINKGREYKFTLS